jgi:hypothetical protein
LFFPFETAVTQLAAIQLTRFKDQNPSTIKEEKNAKTEFDRVAEGFDVVDVVVESFPEGLTAGVEEEQRVGGEADENLKSDGLT